MKITRFLFHFALFVLVLPFVCLAQNNQMVQKLSSQNPFTIDPCDGTKTLANTFDIGIFSASFFDANKLGVATSKDKTVEVYDVVSKATTMEMFASLQQVLSETSLTQNQIVSFCKKYPHIVSQEHQTLFLFKQDRQLLIAHLFYDEKNDLSVAVWPLGEDSRIWYPGLKFRLVVAKPSGIDPYYPD